MIFYMSKKNILCAAALIFAALFSSCISQEEREVTQEPLDASVRAEDAQDREAAVGGPIERPAGKQVCSGRRGDPLPLPDGGFFWGPPPFCDPTPYIEKGRPTEF